MFFNRFSVICIVFILSGCDQAPKFASLCEEHPNICQEFVEDSWCKRERISVGFSNVNHLKESIDINKFHQLISYEKYAKCMSHASLIEHIKFKEKKTIRVNNVAKAKKKIKEISELTKDSRHPNLMYYHWTRYLDENALNRFLALENTKTLETPELQFNLATYYVKIDQNKTLKLLYRALELTDKDEAINTEIFKSISTIFADKKKQKQAYIWSKILLTHEPEDETVSVESLTKYAKSFELNIEFLDRVAQSTLNKIHDGEFKAPKS